MHAALSVFALIEDDLLMRDLLVETVQARFQPAALHAFSCGLDGLQHCLTTATDVLLVDLVLPDLDGREIIRRVMARTPRPRVIVLTGHLDSTLPAELIALGVAGFVDKSAPLEHVMRAIERVLAGGMYFYAGVIPPGSAVVRIAPNDRATPAALSAREREIAQLVVAGMSSKEIAARLGLSTRTVENYRAHVMQKVGVRDTVSLVHWCLRHGLG